MDFEALLGSQPWPAGVLLRGMPSGAGREDHLVRQVMALANADLAGPRCLLFGIEPGAAGALSVVGLDEMDVAVLESQRQLCRDAVEPSLELTLVRGQVAGKSVAGLVVGNAANPPYLASTRAPAPLRAGECWLFDAQGMRCASRADLDGMYATRRQRREKPILVGIGDDPHCELLDMQIPDASMPPSRAAALKLRSAIAAKKTAAAVMGRDDTEMARLAHARIFGAEAPFNQHGLDTLVRAVEAAPEDYREADLHHRFEQQAVHLDICVLNRRAEALTGAAIEITLPGAAGFVVASRLYPRPGEALDEERKYPEVRRDQDCFRVRSSLGVLSPGQVSRVFATPLRLAVDRTLLGQKIAIRYSLVAENLDAPCYGRLRVRFRD